MGNIVRLLLSVLFFSPFFFSQTISWEQLSGPHGGGIYSIVHDNVGNIYANTVSGTGPFKSTDEGESWFSIKNGLTPNPYEYHPLNINSNGDLFIGNEHNTAALCRSTDGGSSWEPLNNLNPGSSIICIAFDAAENIYVGTGIGIYKSTDNGDNWSQYGMNGSQTEAIAFNDSGHVFAGTSYAVYRSIDDGANWTQLPSSGGQARSIAIADNGYLFAGYWGDGGIRRSTDNGDSWNLVYPQTVSVYFASTVLFDVNGDIYFPTWGSGVLKSTDNGDSWTEFNDGLGYKYIRAIGKSLTGPLFAGSGYGIYKTDFTGTSWYSVGLPIAGVKEIAINSNDDIFAGVWGVNCSTDGGQSWQTINNGFVNLDIRALIVKDNGYLFAGTNDSQDGTVFRSTDNGENWIRVDDFPSGIAINGLAVGLSGEIIATASGYHILCQKSTDDGITWQDIKYGQDIGCGKVAYNSTGDLFSASYGGGLWRLPAGDTIWTYLSSIGSNWISSLLIGNNDYIYANGMRSTDNGDTWTQLSITAYPTTYCENSIGHIFAGNNYNGGVWRSTDYGENWEQISSGLTTMEILSLAVDSGDYLYAGTNGKSVFKTTTSTVTAIDDIKFEPASFYLEQNFPNPFNPSTKISWQSPVSSWQTLKVYDVLGAEVATLVDEYKPAGNYEIEFNSHSGEGQNLPSGVYFYKLKAGNFVETKKMVLMK